MSDLEKALADIAEIRERVAQTHEFRGFGPVVVAATGGIAVVGGLLQTQIGALQSGLGWLLLWLGVAAVAAGLVVGEMLARRHRAVFHLSDDAIWGTLERFMPSLFVGAMLTLVFWTAAAELLHVLPGLWAIMIGMGIFAALPNLPRNMRLVGGWYLATGLLVLMAALSGGGYAPFHMVLPFGAGQVLMALLLARAEAHVK